LRCRSKKSADAAYGLAQLYSSPEINQGGAAIASYAEAVSLAEAQQVASGALPSWYPDALYHLGDLTNQTGNAKVACDAWGKWLTLKPKKDAKEQLVRREMAISLRCGGG
jgi:hypothetical protein